MSQYILWASLTQAFSFAEGFCLSHQTVLTWICFAPRLEGMLWGS